jgi:uncharacterized cysteine cluster protein YcgN (CxxCxxCC family)
MYGPLLRWWEGICLECGRCCHEKEYISGTLYYYQDRPCHFLDKNTRKCTVYKDRFRLMRGCRRMTLFRAMFAGWLPEECGYVQWAKRHHIRFNKP